MSERARLVRLGLILATDLERGGTPGASGLIRMMCRELAADRPTIDGDEANDVCPVCGDVIVQSSTGRPRMYCSPRCRERARLRKPRGAATVSDR